MGWLRLPLRLAIIFPNENKIFGTLQDNIAKPVLICWLRPETFEIPPAQTSAQAKKARPRFSPTDTNIISK